MLLLLRGLKRNLFATEKFRNYLLYALGEMVLVVIGILIALQIDNWNTRNTRQAALHSYLGSIAENMESDLKTIDRLQEHRNRVFEDIIGRSLIDESSSLSVPEIAFASNALLSASKIDFFVPSDSAYDGLKSSGHLDQLRGTDVERLLYDYYDTANRIKQAETSFNDDLRALYIRVLNDWPREMSFWAYRTPSLIDPARLKDLQPVLRSLQDDPGIATLMSRALDSGSLLRDYERLNVLGRSFVSQVGAGKLNFDTENRERIATQNEFNENAGYPHVMRNGQIVFHSYTAIFGHSNIKGIIGHRPEEGADNRSYDPFDFNTLQRSDESLLISYNGGVHWAAISLVLSDQTRNQPSRDYSNYETLWIEAKRETEQGKVYVNMKDKDDPPDGTQTNIELNLSDEWQVIEIPLKSFENADLASIHVAIAFLFLDGPMRFSVRNIGFKAD